MSKRKSEQEVVDVFADLFNQTVDVQHHIPKEGATRDENFTKKKMPKVEDWHPIYADRPNSYQADLMFEPYVNSKEELILQAILCDQHQYQVCVRSSRGILQELLRYGQ